MGTMVGSQVNGSNQIGVAPDATWIAVKVFDDAGRRLEDYLDLRQLISDPALRERMGRTALAFVAERRGATDRILSYLEKLL